MKVERHRHDVDEADIEEVVSVLRGTSLATGDRALAFEEKLAGYLSVPHCVTVSSGAAALHLALLGLDVGPGDEVITSAMTFVATVNAILHVGATPVLVDIDEGTGLMDPDAVEAAITSRTRAILPVHLNGQLADMRRLAGMARERRLLLVEDAAHAVEAVRDGVRPGQLSDAGCFSFHATSTLTCGQGGAITVQREDLAARLREFRSHGISSRPKDPSRPGPRTCDLTRVGFEYDLDDIRGALLVHQLDRLDGLREIRERVCRRYEKLLCLVPGTRQLVTVPDTIHARHLLPVRVMPRMRDRVIEGLCAREIGVAHHYPAIPDLTFYKEYFRDVSFPRAKAYGDSVLSLPMYPRLTEAEQDHVVAALAEILGRLKGNRVW